MIEQLTEAERRQGFLASLFYLREQRTTSDHEVIECGERRDSEIKLAKRVLSRWCTVYRDTDASIRGICILKGNCHEQLLPNLRYMVK